MAPFSPSRPGAATTIRSELSPWARVTRALTVSSLAPHTTPMRSFRASEAALMLSRMACWTVSVSESHTMICTSSTASRAAKASSYPSVSATGTAATAAAPLRSSSRISSVMASSSPKAATASS